MANHLYGYDPYSYGAASGTSNLSSIYTSRSLTDPYLSTSRYLASSDPSKYSDPSIYLGGYSASTSHLVYPASWPGVDASVDPVFAGLKRPSEAIYHQTVFGAHNAYGQSEDWLSSTDYLAKRPRFESASNLPIYPQRPGEKHCAHYMHTRTCNFGDSCKFDHPIWVPEGGIPDWKEVPLVTTEPLPERPGEPDCPYFLKTQRCKFGLRCKFNHPKDKTGPLGAPESVGVYSLPERPFEPPCAFYLKTGMCKFGGTCKFHHPKDIQIPSGGQEIGSGEQTKSATTGEGTIGVVELVKPSIPVNPALLLNSKGLPIRMGEVDCPFYLKTGSCKYGSTCRYNHPDRIVIKPPAAAATSQAFGASPAARLNIGVVNPGTSVLHSLDPRLASTTLGFGPTIYPHRPGQMECDFYMKTGVCKFGELCRFHHPIDRTAPSAKVEENVKLTLAGFRRREGAIICPYYMKTGTCKYGPACKFDHPPPGEVMAMAISQGTTTSARGEGKGDEKDAQQ